MPAIILADDHELIREAVKPYLLQLFENVTIWEAGTYEEVLALGVTAGGLPEAVPLALLDLDMPGVGDGFESLRRVCLALPQTAVVVFSASEDSQTIAAVLQNGARGYVPKTTRGRSLVNALRLVLEGEVYVPPSVVKNIVYPEIRSEARDGGGDSIAALLSAREAASLRLLKQGMTNKAIARELGLQDVTVKMHLRNAYRKIGATNRIEAVRIAIEKGFE